MLSDIMLAIMAVITPVMCFFAFKMGLDTAFLFGEVENKPMKTPKLKKLRKKPVESEEIRKYNAVLANIEAYDGTGFGQKEIK